MKIPPREDVIARREEIVARYVGGESCVALAASLVTTPTTILKYLRRWSVTIRQMGAPKAAAPSDPAQLERIRSMRAQGMSLRQIGDELGVSYQAVQGLLRRWEAGA